MARLTFIDLDVITDLENRFWIESEVIPRAGDQIEIPGERNSGLIYTVERVRLDWGEGGPIPDVFVYIRVGGISH